MQYWGVVRLRLELRLELIISSVTVEGGKSVAQGITLLVLYYGNLTILDSLNYASFDFIRIRCGKENEFCIF